MYNVETRRYTPPAGTKTTKHLNNNAPSPRPHFAHLAFSSRILDSNSLSALPRRIFQELGQLELLWLDNNSLTTLPSEIFSGLGALQELFLQNNPGLQCVPTSSAHYVEVDDIIGSEVCGCTPNGTVMCDDGAFCMSGEFGYSCVTPAPSAAPTPVPTAEPSPAPTPMPTRPKNPCLDPTGGFYVCNANGTELNVDYCGIDDTDMGDVEMCLDVVGRETATRVSMRFNYLTVLPEDIFHGLGHVEELYLGNNRLSSLPTEIFQSLGKLTILSLNGNSLTHLSAGLFQGLGQLQHLRINFNGLTTLPAVIFDGLTVLKSLDLRMNPELQCVPHNVAETVNVTEVASRHGWCGCSLAPAAMCGNTACAPGEHGYTCATSSPTPAPSAFAPDNNTCLDPASDTYICNTPGTQIDFSFCGITDEDLEEVAACLDVFGRGTMSHLHLHYNFLTRIHADLFQGCGQLEELFLNDNALTSLPAETFQGVGGLKVLNLNRNDLAGLPGNIFQKHENSTTPAQLQELLLNMNDLTTLPAEIFEELPLLEELDLRLNPDLQCVPNNSAVNVDVDDDFSPDMCECYPARAVSCTFGAVCLPGELGHICYDV